MTIHHTALIDSTAKLEDNVSVGPFTMIGANSLIGEGSEIGPQVQIKPGTIIGNHCRIFQGASVGGEPQIIGFDPDLKSSVKIGDHTAIREYVTVHRSGEENGVTEIGSHCMLMAYTHVAHDCKIGNHVVLVNYTGLPGHILVEDHAFISGLVGIHQFARIGKHSMVGGMAAVRKDVLPFSLVEGNPARLVSANSVGLRRSKIPRNVRQALKNAIRLICDSEFNTSQALEQIQAEIEMFDEIRYLIDFIENSSRGVTK